MPQRGSIGPDGPPVDLRTRPREVEATSAEAGAAADRGRGSGGMPDGCAPITVVKPSPPRPSPEAYAGPTSYRRVDRPYSLLAQNEGSIASRSEKAFDLKA
jgi:hypothetical protein